MSTSWQPELKPRSFYSHPIANSSPAIDRKSLAMRGASDIQPSRVARTRRVWHSRKTGNHPEVESLKTPNPCHSRDEMLFVRQLMIERNGLCSQPAVGNGNLKAVWKEVEEDSSGHEILKKLSTDSICSTTDTYSDASDELDGATSSTFVEESLPLQSALRASAPEFIPDLVRQVALDNDSALASSSYAQSENLNGSGFVLATTVEGGDMRTEGKHVHAEHSCSESYLDAAALRCYEEWRQYCGLTSEFREIVPHSFRCPWANRSSLADVFAASGPGELFAMSR